MSIGTRNGKGRRRVTYGTSGMPIEVTDYYSSLMILTLLLIIRILLIVINITPMCASNSRHGVSLWGWFLRVSQSAASGEMDPRSPKTRPARSPEDPPPTPHQKQLDQPKHHNSHLEFEKLPGDLGFCLLQYLSTVLKITTKYCLRDMIGPKSHFLSYRSSSSPPSIYPTCPHYDHQQL